jgi:uncharacterized protein YtpQ (UPF0354 family)
LKREHTAKKKDYYVIKLNKIYDVVADSLAVATRDRSAKRIREALICCLVTLKKDGHRIDRPIATAAIKAIQKRLSKHPDIQ